MGHAQHSIGMHAARLVRQTETAATSVLHPAPGLASARLSINRPAKLFTTGHGQAEGEGAEATPAPAQTALAAAALSGVAFTTGSTAVQVPLCGITQVMATTVPANLPGAVAWSLAAGTAQVANGTRISTGGAITFGATQTGGTIQVHASQTLADGSSSTALAELVLCSHPTGINRTRDAGAPSSANTVYGALFDHAFTSADNLTSSLENVPVGEQFPALPNPTGTSHTLPTPFGLFTLATRNLPAAPANGQNWFITNGELGGTHDSVTLERSLVNAGDFVTSASNPTPAHTLPVSFSVTQELHWFCRQAAQWNKISDVSHVRTLRVVGNDLEFATSVNGEEHTDPYRGQPAITGARATPAVIPPTTNARTLSRTTVIADTLPGTLPAGHALRFSIQGAALGSTIDARTGVLTAGNQAGSVTVQVRDSVRGNTNTDEATVQIVTPAPAPAAGQSPNPGVGPGAAPGAPASQAESTDEAVSAP